MAKFLQIIPSARKAFIERKPVHFVPTPKWVRVYFGGEFIADSNQVRLLFGETHVPIYYFPKEDVRMEALEESGKTESSTLIGDARYYHVRAGDQEAKNAAWEYPQPRDEAAELKDYIAFEWDKMDAWFEETEQVHTHPHDPYVRIDTHRSERHVRVELEGVTVAETDAPVVLFETGLPMRFYIPKVDVHMDLLEPSDLNTFCAYKGKASYYHLRIDDQKFENIIWYYPYPNPQYTKIQNLLAFFNEKVDLYVDGEKLERPKTEWS